MKRRGKVEERSARNASFYTCPVKCVQSHVLELELEYVNVADLAVAQASSNIFTGAGGINKDALRDWRTPTNSTRIIDTTSIVSISNLDLQ